MLDEHNPAPQGRGNRAGIDYGGIGRRRLDTTIAPNAATHATWGEPSATARQPRIALVAWRPLAKGALRGFATIQLPLGLRLIDCPVLVSNGKPWVSLPAKPVLDRDGQHKADPNGKPAYAPVAEWRSRELRDRFSEAVIAAIRRMYPEALDGSGS
jgi:hypothetical protein